MNTRKKQIVLLVVFLLLIVLLRVSPVGSVLTFDNLKQHRDELAAAVRGTYMLSVVLFIGIYILVTALSIPGAVVLTLAGGFLFGTVATTIFVNIGATAGAALAFLSARYLLGNRVQDRYGEQLRRFNEEIEKNGTSYLLTLRFIPIFPFFLINFLTGLTAIPLRTFLWTTALGIIPGTAVYAFAGRQIGSINRLSEILSPKAIGAFVALAVFALIPVLWKRLRNGKRSLQ